MNDCTDQTSGVGGGWAHHLGVKCVCVCMGGHGGVGVLDELPIICADVDGLALVEVWEEAHKPCVVFDCILHARPSSTPSLIPRAHPL